MTDIQFRQIPTNGIELHAAVQGSGPLVVFCHGFPGLWYSWRHQLQCVANLGFTAVALDMRGYGKSTRPSDFAEYHIEQQIEDMRGVLAEFNVQSAVFVGHDFGANLVWSMTARHPEMVRGVVGVSVPFGYALGDNEIKPSDMFADIAQNHFFHMHYFQQPSIADAELSNDSKLFLSRLFWALSAKGNLLDWTNYPSKGTGYLDVLAEPEYPLPWHWMSEADMDFYVTEYERAGKAQAFSGGLSSYRVADINWQLEKPYRQHDIKVPACYITGSEDPVLKLMTNNAIEIMQKRVPELRGLHLIENAGHFVQQEQADEFNTALIGFLNSLN